MFEPLVLGISGRLTSCRLVPGILCAGDIVGRIIVSQNNETLADSEKVLSTNRTTNFTFELHDPSEYFKGSTISLSWKVHTF